MKVLILCLSLIRPAAHAQLGPHEEQGLKDTKQFLVSPGERQKFVDKDAKAKDADNKVEALAGSKENKEEIYSISAEVMDKLTRETGGDPAKMQKILEEAQSNPKAFYEKYFDENTRARVRGVANDIEKRGTVTAPAK